MGLISAAMALAPMKKVVKAAGAMKAMKSKRASVIAKGKRARAAVFSGRKQKTSTGLTAAKLMRNSRGKIVSKAASARAKSRYAKGLGMWISAVVGARKALGVSKGFVAINGKTAEGKAIYAKAKELYNKSK